MIRGFFEADSGQRYPLEHFELSLAIASGRITLH